MAQLTADSVVGPANAREEGRLQVGALAGVVVGTMAVFGAFLMEGGDIGAVLLPSPVLIVVGGTIAALLLAYPAPAVAGIPGLVGRAFTGRHSTEGAQLLRDAGSYAIITSLVALAMAAIIILANLNLSRPDQMGHALSLAFIAPLYGLLLSLICFALSRRLRGAAA